MKGAVIPKASPDAARLSGRDIVCFSHDWSGDPLSKTHLMRVLSRNNRVLWVNAIANRTPTASSKDVSRIFDKLRAFADPVREVEPNIFVLNPLAIPAYGSRLVRGMNRGVLVAQVRSAMRKLRFRNVMNFVFNPAAGLLAGRIGEEKVVYYCVDEYTAFTGVATGLKEIEERLFTQADLVVVSADRLYESKKRFNPNTRLIRHGTDWTHFRKAVDGTVAVPPEIASLPKPVIGFHGLLADWVDFGLIKKTAEAFPEGSVVLIGKVSVDAEKKVRVLDGIPNVHLLGRKPYEDLPSYCRGFDVAINPFVVNELTLAANPLKVREYLAAGLPVVTTDIPEVRILKDCLVAGDHERFVALVREAMSYPRTREQVSDAVRHESWESKVQELSGFLQ